MCTLPKPLLLPQVAKAAAESEAASMENSSAEASEQGDSPPASPGAGA